MRVSDLRYADGITPAAVAVNLDRLFHIQILYISIQYDLNELQQLPNYCKNKIMSFYNSSLTHLASVAEVETFVSLLRAMEKHG